MIKKYLNIIFYIKKYNGNRIKEYKKYKIHKKREKTIKKC